MAARLARSQPAKPGLNPDVNQAGYPCSLASGKRVFSCPIIIVPKPVAVQQGTGSADEAVAEVLKKIRIATAHAAEMAAHGLVEGERTAPDCARTSQHQVELRRAQGAVVRRHIKRRSDDILYVHEDIVTEVLEIGRHFAAY